jgi:hypothetical protein
MENKNKMPLKKKAKKTLLETLKAKEMATQEEIKRLDIQLALKSPFLYEF